jgi:type II secretory pathway component PulF
MLLFVCGVLAFLRPLIGFTAGIVFGATQIYLGIIFERDELIAGGIAVFLITMLIIAFKKWPFWMKWISIICGSGLLAVAGFMLFGIGGFYGILFYFLFIGAMISAAVMSGLTTAAYVTSTISSSVRQNLPLPMAMEMAAAGQNNRQAKILRNIKKWLIEGYSLSESIKRGYPRFPGYATALITVGERIGQLPQALAALEQDFVAKVTLNKKIRHVPSFYPPILLLIMFIFVLFLMTFVIPRFQAVLEDMVGETQLPWATLVLMRIVRFITHDFGRVLGMAFILGFTVGGAIYVRIKTRPRRPEKPYFTSLIGDFLRWHIPFVRWYEWNRAMQRIAGMLRLSLNAGCTINESIANTLQLDINDCFKVQLKEWRDRVERGDDISEAARQCGMGSAMAWVFADVNNHRNMLDILDAIEASYRWGFSRAATLARCILGPCETLCLGLMVGFIVYAVFAPIVTIIYATANSFVP